MDPLTATFKFEHGAKVRNELTGQEGIVMGRTDWITGCNRYVIQPHGLDKDNKPYDTFGADEDALTLIKAPTAALKKIAALKETGEKPPGGPHKPQRNDDKDHMVT